MVKRLATYKEIQKEASDTRLLHRLNRVQMVTVLNLATLILCLQGKKNSE